MTCLNRAQPLHVIPVGLRGSGSRFVASVYFSLSHVWDSPSAGYSRISAGLACMVLLFNGKVATGLVAAALACLTYFSCAISPHMPTSGVIFEVGVREK